MIASAIIFQRSDPPRGPNVRSPVARPWAHSSTVRAVLRDPLFPAALEFTRTAAGSCLSRTRPVSSTFGETSIGGGRQQQVTAFESNMVRSVAPAPDGKTIVFTADAGRRRGRPNRTRSGQRRVARAVDRAPQVQHLRQRQGLVAGRQLPGVAANAACRPTWTSASAIGTATSVAVRRRDVRLPGRMVAGRAANCCSSTFAATPTPRSIRRRGLRRVAEADAARGRDHLSSRARGRGTDRLLRRLERGWRISAGLAFFRLDGELEWLETPEGDVEEVDLSEDGRVLAWLETTAAGRACASVTSRAAPTCPSHSSRTERAPPPGAC